MATALHSFPGFPQARTEFINIVPYFVSFLTSIFFHLINKHTLQPTFGEDITQLTRALPFFHYSSKILGSHAFLLAIGTEWAFLKHVGCDINRSTWLYPNRWAARPPFRAARNVETGSIVALKVKLFCPIAIVVFEPAWTLCVLSFLIIGHCTSAPFSVEYFDALVVVPFWGVSACTRCFLSINKFIHCQDINVIWCYERELNSLKSMSHPRSKGQSSENPACWSFIDSLL